MKIGGSMGTTRKRHSAAAKELKNLSELASEHGVH